MNPGMLLKLDAYSINAMKGIAQDLLPKVLVVDLGLPESYTYEWHNALPGFSWDFTWDNINYH